MSSREIRYSKVLVHLLSLLPLLHLAHVYQTGALATKSDPVEWLTHFTGNWALWMLLASLTITPARRIITSLSWLVRLRRIVGLYAFFYATLHLLLYVFAFSGYDTSTAIAGLQSHHPAEPWHQLVVVWPTITDDLATKRFLQIGLVAWVLLLALAVTSPLGVLRAMGGKNWQRLHRLVYAAAIAAVLHYWWLVKKGVRTPWKVTAILVVLLALRSSFTYRKRRQRPPSLPDQGNSAEPVVASTRLHPRKDL